MSLVTFRKLLYNCYEGDSCIVLVLMFKRKKVMKKEEAFNEKVVDESAHRHSFSWIIKSLHFKIEQRERKINQMLNNFRE